MARLVGKVGLGFALTKWVVWGSWASVSTQRWALGDERAGSQSHAGSLTDTLTHKRFAVNQKAPLCPIGLLRQFLLSPLVDIDRECGLCAVKRRFSGQVQARPVQSTPQHTSKTDAIDSPLMYLYLLVPTPNMEPAGSH